MKVRKYIQIHKCTVICKYIICKECTICYVHNAMLRLTKTKQNKTKQNKDSSMLKGK